MYCYAHCPVVVCMVVVHSPCQHQPNPRSVISKILAQSVIVSYATDPPRPPSPRSSPTNGASGKPQAVDNDDNASPSQSILNIDCVTLCLHCHPPPPEMPFTKLAEDDFQEIECVPPRFRVGVLVILHCNATAVVALLILPPNEQCVDVDLRHRRRRGRRTPPPPRHGAFIAAIEQRRIPSTRRRRESSRRRLGSTPSHPSHSSSFVTSAAADATADAVP